MTEKQKRFCLEYIKDPNATQAAIRAGYNPKSAKSIGSENLTKPDIQKYIQEAFEKLEKEKIADANEVIKYLTSVLRGESDSEEIVVEGIGEGYSKARLITKKPGERDKLKAAELLGKSYGIFTDKVDLDADMDLNICIDYGEGE